MGKIWPSIAMLAAASVLGCIDFTGVSDRHEPVPSWHGGSHPARSAAADRLQDKRDDVRLARSPQ
jgi:hypothetical protein